ncbi:MAG: hypothetical protein ACREEM_13060 [Blastocatellia bacterium]
MADNELTLNARVRGLETQVAELKGAVEQQNRSIATGNRLNNWQFIGFVFVMAGTLLGTLYWATGLLERRLDQMDRRIDQVEKNLIDRIEQSEKNINARFEDLRQVVLSQQKQQQLPPKR